VRGLGRQQIRAGLAKACGKILLVELGEYLARLNDLVDVDVQPLDDAVCLRLDFDFGDRLDLPCCHNRPLKGSFRKLLIAMWILRTVAADSVERTFRIVPGGARTIGRATGADFIIDAALISRVHCRLTALPSGELEVRDLESTNGTYVNGKRIGTARLAPGDRLKVGRVELIAERDA
jgi:hypothetical protein